MKIFWKCGIPYIEGDNCFKRITHAEAQDLYDCGEITEEIDIEID